MIHNPDKDMRNKGSHINSLVVKFQCELGSRVSNYYLCLICEFESIWLLASCFVGTVRSNQ